ncbi:MAG TPA: peptide ABC transporter substrate-binding protein [Acetobacteraceae bacterium]|nr:peptide ABC transporter substrate-binding protein [Acetobacteraceae bacterium]
MDEEDLRGLIADVRAGKLPRRAFIARMVALGLTAPLATQMLVHSGLAAEATPFDYKPTKRGGGGPLRVLWWQAPTLLNPHFAVGTKDQEASRIFYEPLAGWDPDGNLVPILAASIPTVENGLLAEDGKSVTWKLKKGVTWHDGKPFTADDCVFTAAYCADPATAAYDIATYKDIKVSKLDDYTVKIEFPRPTPYWADAFVGARGMILPQHAFGDYKGANSRQAPANLAPIGTGPYMFVEFRPGDMVSGKLNPNYHEPNRPYFDTIEMKGGGDAVSAARAVLQSGEYDYAWNLQVENEILQRLVKAGQGRIEIIPGGNIEHIQINFTDPWKEVDGQRSALGTKHPFFSDPAVRQAMNMLVDRNAVHEYIYGPAGIATANFLNNPERYRSKDTSFVFDVGKAAKTLEDAGWKPGADGTREKNGVKLHVVYQTSVNAPRQQNQQIVKQAAQKAGISMELKAVTASVFFSSDVANPDTYTHFYSDIQMYTTTMTQPDPGQFMLQFVSWEVAQKSNKWAGRNITRWQNPDYDALWKAADAELDPVKRAALFIKMNDMVINDVVVIPVVYRPGVAGVKNNLQVRLSGWDNDMWALKDWYRT